MMRRCGRRGREVSQSGTGDKYRTRRGQRRVLVDNQNTLSGLLTTQPQPRRILPNQRPSHDTGVGCGARQRGTGRPQLATRPAQRLPSTTTSFPDCLLHTGSRALRHRQRALSAAARRGHEAELARGAQHVVPRSATCTRDRRDTRESQTPSSSQRRPVGAKPGGSSGPVCVPPPRQWKAARGSPGIT